MPSIKTVDAAASYLSTSTGTMLNDGEAEAIITLTLLDTDGNPIVNAPAASCVLAVTGTGNTVTQPTGFTNASGQVSGSFATTQAATKTASYTVAGAAVTDTVAVVASGTPISLPAANKFIDGLEGADKTASDPNGINVDGFAWTSGAGIPFSIVRSDGYVVWSAGNPGAAIDPPSGPFPDRQWENAPDGTAGTHAARFRYPGSLSTQFAEQRFNLGADYPDLWLRYWIRVPINFNHEENNPSNNNKWLSLWQNTYDDTYTRTWEYWPKDPADGGSRISWHVGGGGHVNYTDFITYPTDQGRWMQVVHHLKVSSDTDVADGVVQLYRRWEDEDSFTTIHNRTDVVINIDAGRTGFRYGFILGASNSDWVLDTEWLVDRFEVSTTSLIP